MMEHLCIQPDGDNNIDDDHLVHYKNIFENLLESFVMFSENVPFYGYLMINGDDKNIKKISKEYIEIKITFVNQKAAIIKLIILPNAGQKAEIYDKKITRIINLKSIFLENILFLMQCFG